MTHKAIKRKIDTRRQLSSGGLEIKEAALLAEQNISAKMYSQSVTLQQRLPPDTFQLSQCMPIYI